MIIVLNYWGGKKSQESSSLYSDLLLLQLSCLLPLRSLCLLYKDPSNCMSPLPQSRILSLGSFDWAATALAA